MTSIYQSGGLSPAERAGMEYLAMTEEKLSALIDYIAMMTDVDIFEEDNDGAGA